MKCSRRSQFATFNKIGFLSVMDRGLLSVDFSPKDLVM